MGLTVVRYRESPVLPYAEARVNSPQEALSLLRTWQRAYPHDTSLLLDEHRQAIATARRWALPA